MTLARWKDLCFDVTAGSGGPGIPGYAAFWADALGGRTVQVQDNGDAVLRGQAPGQTVWVNQVAEPKTVKNRVHLDLVLASVQPLVDTGATVVREPTDESPWHLLADPAGAELCVFPAAPGEPSALVADAADQRAAAAWWADLLGARLTAGPDGVLRWLADVPGLPFDVWKFVEVPEPKTVKNRVHWDVWCDDVPALLDRGATLLRPPDDVVRWHVLADPEGNEFCAFASS